MNELTVTVKGPHRGDFEKMFSQKELSEFSSREFPSLLDYLDNLNVDDLSKYLDIDTVKDGFWVEVYIGNRYSLWTRMNSFNLEDGRSGYVTKYPFSEHPIRFRHSILSSSYTVKDRVYDEPLYKDVNNIQSSFDKVCFPRFTETQVEWHPNGGHAVQMIPAVLKHGYVEGHTLDDTPSPYYMVHVFKGFGYWCGAINEETVQNYFEREFVRFDPNRDPAPSIYTQQSSQSPILCPSTDKSTFRVNIGIDTKGFSFYE